MKITQILIYQVDVPLKIQQPMRDRYFSSHDCTVVEVQTDAGITGYGEVCPIGSIFSSAHPTGVREVLRELAPQLLGGNPLQVGVLSERMDYLLKGHAYAKSPLDMAFWDILGKHTQLPLCDLLGGCCGDNVNLYCGLTRESTLSQLLLLKEEGFKFFSWKSKGDVSEDVTFIRQMQEALDHDDRFLVDGNTVYPVHDACRLAHLTKDVYYFLEQPCMSLEECKQVHNISNQPMILDECIESQRDLFTVKQENFAHAVKLKMSRLGGITRTRQARDICLAMGMPVFIEDAWGTELTTSAAIHFGHSTPEKYRMAFYPFARKNKIQVWEGGPIAMQGKMAATLTPGLGVMPKPHVLGKPVYTF